MGRGISYNWAMPRLPRCRAVMKWLGTLLCVTIVATWYGSLRHLAACTHARSESSQAVWVESGCVLFNAGSGPDYVFDRPVGWSVYEYPTGWPKVVWRWSPRVLWGKGSVFLELPLYIPFTLLALPAAFLFYRDRRHVRWAREGRCVWCGYDLSGVTGTCPECGRKAA